MIAPVDGDRIRGENGETKCEEVSSVKRFLAIVLVFLPLIALAQPADDTPQVVAKVNGEEITKAQLDRLTNISGIVFSLYRQYPRFAQVLLTTDEGKALLRAYERSVLDSLINWRLLVQEAHKRGLTVPEDELASEVEKTLQGIMERNQLTEAQLADILKAQRGQTLEEFRNQIKTELEEKMLVDLLKDAVTAEVSVSEDEITSYYEEHKDSFADSEGNVKNLDEVKEDILTALMNEKKDSRWRSFLKDLREQAEVEIYL